MLFNVVELLTLQTKEHYPRGLSTAAFDSIFTKDTPTIFAFHGYPSLIHKCVYLRKNHGNFHVKGYHERGTVTTPFDNLVLNGLDLVRENLVG